VKVHVEIHGVPVGVKTQGGVLDFVTRELEVECLPMDIPDKLVVDVSELEIGKHLRVSDIKVSDKVKVLTELDIVVVHVVAPRAEEEVAPAVEAAPVEGAVEPEVIKKGKTAAEGEVAEEKPEKPEKGEKGEKGEKREKK
jgi:large subunit ribosomal protein L25